MKNSITPAALFEKHQQGLGLVWVAGSAGAVRVILSSPSCAGAAPGALGFPLVGWVGYLNVVSPHCVQVVGRAETAHLFALGADERAELFSRLFEARPAFIVVSDGEQAPPELISMCDATATPLFRCDAPGYEVIGKLQYYLADVLAERMTLHGVFMAVYGIGVLLTGESGIGKSEVALELISRGHRLIADDAPEFHRIAPDIVSGCCAVPELSGFLEVRGLGVLDIRSMFGDSAINLNKVLRLIIELKRMSGDELGALDRLKGSRQERAVLGVPVTQLIIPVIPGRNLAVLVESAINNQMLLMNGYDAARVFIERQQRVILDGMS
ncbi:MAG: HPr(Ser) kinase/phosphatase [Chromatiales bacterium]|jgi:HPr kinase/phosphorylase|nr:HPr(Ser) kinase/phosphatase [Chromatiales bacterium]